MVLAVSNSPPPTRESNQRSLSLDEISLTRFIFPWSRPSGLSASVWRSWVFNQPIAMICRETLIANFLSLEWRIVARDSNQQDELKPMIRYYTKLLENGGNNPNNFGFDYSGMMEWILADMLDLPFGSGTEIGRRDDSPGGRVLWMKPLDGGTLYPTLNKDYPVVQFYTANDLIPFPAHAIARVYMSPRPEILREGWGLAPPEKVYMALEMLMRGDRYYANLLLDVPPVGLLDLGDMEKDSALEWINAFKAMVVGTPVDAFKIPVLYEHTTDAKFIPFGKAPNDIMYDRITMKYAEIVSAAYGLSLSDIGMSATSNGGETLAGSIRQERKSRRTGIGRVKLKVKGFIDSILPEALEFKVIDTDDEKSVATGRARLSNATSWGLLIDKGIFTPKEARLQTIADGIITINVPEEPPAEAKKVANAALKKPTTPRPGILGRPVPPSGGGQGEVRQSLVVNRTKGFDAHLRRLIRDITKTFAPILKESAQGLSKDEMLLLQSNIDDTVFDETDPLGMMEIVRSSWGKRNWLKVSANENLPEVLRDALIYDIVSRMEGARAEAYENAEIETPLISDEEIDVALEAWSQLDYPRYASELVANIEANLKSFIGRTVLFMEKDFLLAFDGEDSPSYDYIVNRVYDGLHEKFDEFVAACIDLEIENILSRIKLEALNG